MLEGLLAGGDLAVIAKNERATYSAVKTRLHRARSKIRKALDA